MKTSTRTMSEKARAFHALRGDVYPRVHDRGVFFAGFTGIRDAHFLDDVVRTVEVTRVSPTGLTIWTSFLQPEGQQIYGKGMLQHRWLRSTNKLYWNNGIHGLIGEVVFR